MAEILVEFEWFRDLDGYSLLDAVPPDPIAPGGPLLRPIGCLGFPQRVVSKGGRLEPYRPLDQHKTLCWFFASSARTPQGVFNFIQKFGSLTNRDYDTVNNIIEHAETMYSWKSTAEKAGLSSFFGNKPIDLIDPRLSLIVDPVSELPRLRIIPKSLLDALWLQFGQCIAEGTEIKTCKHCGQLFQAGRGTGRRKGAEFCTSDHQITFNSLRRSKE
jgi:hypothetical protein